ncbi:MAG TPA: hypothetical protein VF642_08895 [Propionibacteriaceae bacterium]
MPARISVLIPVSGSEPDLVGLVESLDAQTLPYRDFEVVFVLADAESPWSVRLGDLAQHRPHVRVVAAQEPDATATALAGASSTYVLLLGAPLLAEGATLLPEALERLTAFAGRHGCDAVLGRAVRPNETTTPRVFTSDHPSLGADERQQAAGGPLLVAREVLLGGDGDREDLLAVATVGALGSYPTVRLSVPSPAATEAVVEQLGCELTWADGVLAISAHGHVHPGRQLSGGRLWLRDRRTLVEYWLPLEDHSSEGSLALSARFDLATAADGQPLPDGIWLCGVALALGDDQTLSRVALPATSAPNALVAGRPVVPANVRGQLALDVGARRHPVVGRLAPEQVTIEETARGTLLVARLPEVLSYGSATVPGGLLLGKLRLPAQLVAEEGRDTEVRCYVSGLAGTSSISTQFFGPQPSPAGLDLSITEVGIMTATLPVPEPAAPKAPTALKAPKAPKASNASAASSPAPGPSAQPSARPSRPGAPRRSSAPPARSGTADARALLLSVARPLVRRIRRAVPEPLEPAVKALSRQPVARDLYRKAAGIKPKPRKR